MLKKFFICVLFGLLLFGCTSSTGGDSPLSPGNVFDSKLVGDWRSFSDSHNTQVLELHTDKTWGLSSSSGTWHIENITDSDWETWQIEPYGPTQKIVLDGWNGATADGPIEESETQVDFFWVIYLVNLETYGEDRQVQVKYGHSNWD